MKNKKNYNNLLDSICITILFFVISAACLAMIWFGVINHKEGTNPIATMIFCIIFFGGMMVSIIFLILKYCYSYWILSDDSIIEKKPFSKETVIMLEEIEKVEKKIVSALILGTYRSEAYIIYSKNKKIVILISKRINPDLNFELAKFITE